MSVQHQNIKKGLKLFSDAYLQHKL